MKNKNSENSLYIENDEVKNNNFHLAKSDDELFNESEHIPHIVIRAKRVKSPKKGEYWQILENNKEVLYMAGVRFSKKEKEFLHTAEGMSFLVSSYKSGFKSVVKIKIALNKIVK